MATKWTALAAIFGVRGLEARIELATSDPDAYVRTYARELAERGVTKPTKTLPFLALLDGLDAAKRVAIIDWKSPAEDVEHALKSLRPKPAIDWRWTKAFDEDELDDVSTERVLRAAAANLGGGLVLVNLDTRSDQLAIAVVDSATAKRIQAAMKAVGHRAEMVTPKAMAAPKAKPSKARSPRGTPLATWPSGANDAFGQWRFFSHRGMLRNLFTQKYTTAFDVVECPCWSFGSKWEKRTFATAARCTAAYTKLLASLEQGGWLQFTELEHAKELRANQAAKAKGTLKPETK